MLDYLGSLEILAQRQVLVLVPEVEPRKWQHQLLQNQRGMILANGLHRHSDVTVATVPFRLTEDWPSRARESRQRGVGCGHLRQ
jgi:hypothetical protein